MTRTKRRAVSLQQLSFLFRLSTQLVNVWLEVYVADGLYGGGVAQVGYNWRRTTQSVSFFSSALETYNPLSLGIQGHMTIIVHYWLQQKTG